MMTKCYWKISAKSTNFEISSPGLEIFDEVSLSVSKVTVSTALLRSEQQIFCMEITF